MVEKNQGKSGRDVKKQARLLASLIAGLLMIVGAVVGIVFIVKALMGRQAEIEDIREEIISLLEQLDPIARVQVAEFVIEKELGKRQR